MDTQEPSHLFPLFPVLSIFFSFQGPGRFVSLPLSWDSFVYQIQPELSDYIFHFRLLKLYLKEGGDSGDRWWPFIDNHLLFLEIKNTLEKIQIFIVHQQTHKYCEFSFSQSCLLDFIPKKTFGSKPQSPMCCISLFFLLLLVMLVFILIAIWTNFRCQFVCLVVF